jgi:predicted regulator of Ras-like GTPase activity (Roadblock/LC7/MglB family)
VARDVKTLTKELAEHPDSMVFLELAEKLRVRGQLHGAAKVLVTGLTKHPGSADAHDLYARVLVDMGHLRHGYEEWLAAISVNPRHVGARKGLGFLSFRWGDLDGALEHLELALAADPMDPSVVQALRMVRDAAENLSEAPTESVVPGVFEGLEEAQRRLLLADRRGRVLGGGMGDAEGVDASEDVAAHASAGAREAERTARLLDLGDWQWVAVEGPGGNLHLSRPTDDSLLAVARDRSVPVGRLTMLAEKASEVAREWLEEQHL